MPNNQNVTLQAKGLYTFPNRLSDVPVGALIDTNNTVIDRDGIISPRRGFKTYGTDLGVAESRSKQLLDYKYRILRHWSSTLDVDSDGTGTFTVLNDATGNPASVLEPVAGTRIRYIEANGNLYFTSSQGIRKISCLNISSIASKPVTQAGMVGALDGYAILNPESGWFTADSSVAYRIVWGIRDENSNVILGAPSQRIVISNSLQTNLVQNYNTLINQLAIVAESPSITLTGDTHSNTTIDNIITTNLSVGMTVSGSGIQANTVISTVGSSIITISLPATTTVVGDSLTFNQKLHDTDYTSQLIASNSDAVTLYNALGTLVTKIDTDLGDQSEQVVSINAIAGNLYTTAGVSDYFTIFSSKNTNEYAVWFQAGGATGSIAPTVNGANLVQITVAIGDTDAQVATKIAFALNTTGDFTATTSSAVITAVNTSIGIANNPAEYVSDPGFTVATIVPGVNPEFGSIPVTPATTPDIPTPTGELNQIDTYLNNIVTELNNTLGISNYGRSFIGGSFTINNGGDTTNVIFSIPDEITTANFYQIYRSAIFTSGDNSTLEDVTPDDELQLIFEDSPTTDQITAKSINFFDNVPDSIRQGGIYLYTNANSGDGIAQANTRPPLVRDIAQYKVCTFFANTITNYSNSIEMLTAEGLVGNTFVITQNSVSHTYTFVSATKQVTEIDVVAGNLYASSGAADYFDIYDANRLNHYKVWFNSGTATPPTVTTETLVECDILSTDTPIQVALNLQNILNGLQGLSVISSSNILTITNTSEGITPAPSSHVTNPGFTITVTSTGTGEDATLKQIGVYSASTPSQEIDATARSLVRIINQNAGEFVSAQYTSGTTDLPGQFLLTTKNVGDAIFYITTNNTTVADLFNPSLGTTSDPTANAATNEVNPNRIFFSRVQQPDAVPIVNFFDVGPKNKNILRILPLRNQLIILSEAGVYFLTGDTPDNFQVSLFDSSVWVKAPDSAVVLNNQVFAFTTQGIATVSDTGTTIISRPIENKLLPLLTSAYPNFETSTFSVNYDSDRAFLLFTVSEPSDTVATICYRFNVFTNTWTSWDVTKTCGVVDFQKDILYLGAGDINFIEIERKSFTRQDQADRQDILNIIAGSLNGTTLSLGGLFNTVQGDALVQTQYLTVAQLNRLLTKLDGDMSLNQHDYSSLAAVPGSDLRTILTLLAAKLDTDSGLTNHTYSADISGYGISFIDTQLAFNVIITNLNSDPNIYNKTYMDSAGTVDYEILITATNTFTSAITIAYQVPLIVGPVVRFKNIPTLTTWAPYHFGDPSMMKQVSESTIIYEFVNFSEATIGFSSDLSPGFVTYEVDGEGNGSWGTFTWGKNTWGGQESSRPTRTYIPVDKQRCRYINGQFSHNNAFEMYALYGISFTFAPISSRAYR